jgi:hypothetical protein
MTFRHFLFLAAFIVTAVSPMSSTHARPVANYNEFQALFEWKEFQPLFFSPEMETTTAPIEGDALSFLPTDWQGTSPYQPILAFHFNQELDAYVILGPSELNGKKVNLLVMNSSGRILAKEVVSALAGDEGFYRIQFGWLRDLNGDHQPDLVIRVHKTTEAGDGAKEFARNIVSAKVWNGRGFASYTPASVGKLIRETDEDTGSYWLQRYRQWNSDSRMRDGAVLAYRQWLAAFPNHSRVAEAKARLAELRK